MRRRIVVALLLLSVALAGTVQTAMAADSILINLQVANINAGQHDDSTVVQLSRGVDEDDSDGVPATSVANALNYAVARNSSSLRTENHSQTVTINGGFSSTNVIALNYATDGSTVQTTTEANAWAENSGTSTANAFSYTDARDNSYAGNNTVATAGNNEHAWAGGISLAGQDATATTSMTNEFGFAMAFGGAEAHADNSGVYCSGNGGRALVISSTGICID